MIKYIKTAHLSSLEKTNGGIVYLLPDVLIKIFTLIPLIFLWRVVMSSGTEVGMTLPQMLSYTFLKCRGNHKQNMERVIFTGAQMTQPGSAPLPP